MSNRNCRVCGTEFATNYGRRVYCGSECHRRFNAYRAGCSNRLASAERSMDKRCNHCDELLGPVVLSESGWWPSNRATHKECRKAYAYEIVAKCDDCGNGIRRRDGDECASCGQRRRRDAARELPPSSCQAEWSENGALKKCDNDAYPGAKVCSKHQNDFTRYGEHRPYQVDREWIATDRRITQSEVAGWRTRLLAEQGGQCALCGTTETDSWHLDHDHRCCPTKGRLCERCVRSVLCRRCNMGLGMFDDDPESLRRAAGYLESSSRMKLPV